ncbi:hypothetical protein COLO4_16488 [Corchorus olitorius]|uniref:Uncharacterized protein n=1 Tax=Corchorus olitorius TaxID=93759 RepID=A0A1R3JH69_9ROSI|nr:hypothetical protein COLO4_16488 [Corchorus olitorius]
MDRRKGKKVRDCQDVNKGKEANWVWTDLPTGIIMEILSRLPLKSIPNCRGSSVVYLRLYQIDRTLNCEETIFGPRLNLPDCSFNLVNSCNGLVLLSGTGKKFVYVCNPVLGEFITIKVPEKDKRNSKAFCFGFSAKTNQYKVLQTFYANKEGPKAEVYTVGTGSWTSLGNAPISIKDQGLCFDAYLHGAFH